MSATKPPLLLPPAPADIEDPGELLEVHRMDGPYVDLEAGIAAGFLHGRSMWDKFVKAGETPINGRRARIPVGISYKGKF